MNRRDIWPGLRSLFRKPKPTDSSGSGWAAGSRCGRVANADALREVYCGRSNNLDAMITRRKLYT